jgi:hypothetical protein
LKEVFTRGAGFIGSDLTKRLVIEDRLDQLAP